METMLNGTLGGSVKGFALGQDHARCTSHPIFMVPWGGQSGEGPSSHFGEAVMGSAGSWESDISRRLPQLSQLCFSLASFPELQFLIVCQGSALRWSPGWVLGIY